MQDNRVLGWPVLSQRLHAILPKIMTSSVNTLAVNRETPLPLSPSPQEAQMASSGHCRRCLRLLRDQSPLKHELKVLRTCTSSWGINELTVVKQTYSPLRFLQTHQFTTSNYTRLQVIPATHSLQPSTSKSAQKLEPKATTSPSTPPPTKVSPTVNTSSSPVLKLAEEVRKRATGFTETYVAYGVTETFVKECARQADYKIVKDKDGQIPKTKDQEDLGVGVAGSWWYERMLFRLIYPLEPEELPSNSPPHRVRPFPYIQHLGPNNPTAHVSPYSPLPCLPRRPRPSLAPTHYRSFQLPSRRTHGKKSRYGGAHDAQ